MKKPVKGQHGGKREGAGNPAYVPTPRDRQLVEILAGVGIQYSRIARVLEISDRTLYTHFRDELDNGVGKVEAKLVGNMLKMAMGNDANALKAMIFLLQCRFGWQFLVAAPPGKKESAVIEAQTAHEESDWGRLVN